MWYSATGCASIFSPLINYGWGHVGTAGTSTWRYMYYWAGAITIAWGIALYWILPGDPVSAKGFDDRQRYIMVARLRSNNAGVRNSHFKMAQIIELLMDPKFWLTFSIATLSMICNVSPLTTGSKSEEGILTNLRRAPYLLSCPSSYKALATIS